MNSIFQSVSSWCCCSGDKYCGTSGSTLVFDERPAVPPPEDPVSHHGRRSSLDVESVQSSLESASRMSSASYRMCAQPNFLCTRSLSDAASATQSETTLLPMDLKGHVTMASFYHGGGDVADDTGNSVFGEDRQLLPIDLVSHRPSKRYGACSGAGELQHLHDDVVMTLETCEVSAAGTSHSPGIASNSLASRSSGQLSADMRSDISAETYVEDLTAYTLRQQSS